MYMLQYKLIDILIRLEFIIVPMIKNLLYLFFTAGLFSLLFLETLEGLSFEV